VTIIFATCAEQPLLTADDEVLAAALAPLGVEVAPVPWTEIDPHAVSDAPPILMRSTWDYHRLPTMFTLWLQALRDSGRAVWNDPTIVLGNIDKIYLQQLETRGVAIPQTRWIERPDAATIRDAMKGAGWSKAVLKPRIAATAYGTFLVASGTNLSEDDLVPARASGALLQEFIPEIAERGETSLIYCEGVFSHAVIKHAKAGDFRVQKDFGGSVELTQPSSELIAFADRVIETVPDATLYARVDAVATSRGPLLMELELIEPELYFLAAPDAAAPFALAIARRLT
jgi:glutathione synthase/RimK-type ligase-like ATP-grasp enzyme